MRYGHDDDWVEDTVSEACAQILRSLHTYKSDITFRGWVARVCCNVCVSELRKSGRHSRALEPLSEDFDVEDSTLLAMDAHAAQAQICQALDRIAPEYRVVLILEYLNGCPLREISQALGIPIGTVKSRRAEGIKRLFRTMPPSFREGFR
jgi:RNA polymerase sigma-70 factor (ECF subfamily)